MRPLKDALRAGDPLRHDEGLSPLEAGRMRATVTSAVVPASHVWNVCTLAAAMLVAGVASATWFIRGAAENVEPAAARVAAPRPAPAAGERRQLLLETPGGTRIIWTFNDSFQLR